MLPLDTILATISREKARLQRDFHVKRIGVFGSYARGEQKEESDIDVLVEFELPVGFFDFLDLEDTLVSLTGKKVDLVSSKGLKPYIGERILTEVIYA